jgi:hypothetical protein
MLQTFDQLHFSSPVETPKHLETFTGAALQVLEYAHTNGLQLERVSVKTGSDSHASHLYLERLEEHPLDREFLSLHLGEGALSASFAHSRYTLSQEKYASRQITVAVEQARGLVYRREPASVTPEEITNNEIAGRHFTNRLIRSLGSFGVYNAEEVEKLLLAS